MEQLEIEIKELESPFKWLQNRDQFLQVKLDYIIQTNIPQPEDELFERYVKYMHVVYGMANHNDIEGSELYATEWTEFFENHVEDAFFMKYYSPLKHVLYASKAHLLYKIGNNHLASEIVQQVKTLSLETDVSKSGILGLKACFFDKYGIKGHENALKFITDAMQLIKDESNWIYMKAKTLRDIRRSELHNNSELAWESLKEEMKLFKELINIIKTPLYLIRLGNTYNDKAKLLCEKAHFSIAKDLCLKGFQCFREALDLEDNPNGETLRLILGGINNVPGRWRWYFEKLATECEKPLLNSIEQMSDTDKRETYFCLAKYYQRIVKDKKGGKEKAEHFFTLAADLNSINAKKELIVLQFENSETYNPCDDIRSLITVYPDKPKKLENLCQIVSYHLYCTNKKDVFKAIDVMKEVIEIDPELSSLSHKRHKTWFKKEKPYNLLENIVYEVKQCLQDRKDLTTHEVDSLSEFMELVKQLPPESYKKDASCNSNMMDHVSYPKTQDSAGNNRYRYNENCYYKKSKYFYNSNGSTQNSVNRTHNNDFSCKNNMENWRKK